VAGAVICVSLHRPSSFLPHFVTTPSFPTQATAHEVNSISMTGHDADSGFRPVQSERAWLYLGILAAGYIGVYLCRKNFAVAVPLLQEAWGASRADVGLIASVSTLAYASGKFIFGPLIDRFGGRVCFLLSLLGVAIFAGMGGLVTGLMALTFVYSANRLTGSAAWGGMVKLVPDWFPAHRLPLAMAVLSLSFVFGGALATLFAGEIAHWSGNNWRAVLAVPAIVLVVLIVVAALVLPKQAREVSHKTVLKKGPGQPVFSRVKQLIGIRRFWIVLGLSFGLTMFRETFNTWTVDFIKTEGGEEVSTRIAAMLATPFDLFGAVGIISLGWAFGRFSGKGRTVILFVTLSSLTVLLWNIPNLFHLGLAPVAAAVGLIGFLSYGPYSLLAGILAVEIRGPAYVATVAGFVDGTGYLASILAGRQFGQIVDYGGYRLGFHVLAGIAGLCAVLCLFLYSGRKIEEVNS